MGEKIVAMLHHELYRAANLTSSHAFGPDQFRTSRSPQEIDLGLAVTKNVHVSRLVVIEIDDDAKAMSPMDRDHGVR